MDELINQVSSRTGISQDQARQAVDTVVEFIKGRLPAPAAAQLESAINSDMATNIANQVGQQLGNVNLGGMFGGNKE